MDNPFEPTSFPTWENYSEHSLDSLIREIKEVDRLSWEFNPWWQRAINGLVEKLTPKPKRLIYDESYIGGERRKPGKLRKLVSSKVQAVRIMMMPKTEKIVSITSALLFLLVGCGAEPHDRPEYNRVISVNGFEHYVNLFQEQAQKLGQDVVISDLVIRFQHIPVEEKKTTLGHCLYGGGRSPTIEIDPDHWSRMSMVQRQLLMFHEMGHCVLRRDHIEDFDSIMNPYLMSKDVFIKDENRFIGELFDTSTYGSMGLTGVIDDSDRHNSCPDFHSGLPDRVGDEVGHP